MREILHKTEGTISRENPRELKMYTGCAFVRDWESGVLEMNQTAYYAENLAAQYGIPATSNIPGSPGVDL